MLEQKLYLVGYFLGWVDILGYNIVSVHGAFDLVFTYSFTVLIF